MSRTCPECQNSYEDRILHCPQDGIDLTSVEAEDDLSGRTVGSYRVTKLLGQGGMGAVYMAEHPVIGSRVAIKFLHPQYSTDKKIVERFFTEARAVNVIGHDNILKILDLDVTEDNRHYFIMEFLHGKPLQEMVRPDEPLALEIAGPILLQVCEALQAAHERNIVHRDLKPDNVHLIIHKGRKNFVKVVDFGIAKVTDESGASSGRTQAGMVMGTPAYMSPEQAGGVTSCIDGRSDVYSLGVMMFQMATGKLPFPGSTFGEVLIGHLQLQPPRPRELNPNVPEAYQAVILKCLAKKQEERYQSMRELHDALCSLMDVLGISREIPVASEEEQAAAAAILGRSRSTPPGGAKPTPPRPRPSLQRGPTRGVATPASTRVEPAPAPRRGSTALFAAIGAGVVAVGAGAVGLVTWHRADQAEEQQRLQRVEERRRAEEDQRRREEQARRESEARVVRLAVSSEPPGATFEATWPGGARAGTTPANDVEVPRNEIVRFTFSKLGFLQFVTDITADAPKVVKGSLVPEKPVDNSSPVPTPVKKKTKPREPSDNIPIEF